MLGNNLILKKSFGSLNSILIFVFSVYMLDTTYMFLFKSNMSALVLILFSILKVFILSGIYGVLADIASRKEFIPKILSCKTNVRKLFWFYFLLTLAPLFVHIILSITIPIKMLPSPFFIGAHFNVVVLYLLANFIVGKYLREEGLSRKKVVVGFKIFLTILAIYTVDMCLFYLPQVFHIKNFYFFRIILFILTYVKLLEFVYFINIMVDAHDDLKKRFNPKKEIYLVSPINGGILNSIAFPLLFFYPPAFFVLESLTPKDYKIRRFLQVTWRDQYYNSDKLVCITCFTSNAYEAYNIAKGFKARGSKVIMGGPHVTFLPDEALEYCDSVVIGEAEGVWEDVIRDYENDCLKDKYFGGPSEESNKKVHQQLLNAPIEEARYCLEAVHGCKFSCDFCVVSSLCGSKPRYKPIDEVIEFAKRIKTKYKSLLFLDNNIYSSPAYAKELFAALKPLKLKWASQSTIDIGKDEDTIRLAKESGCKMLLFGYEIFRDSFEKAKGGKFNFADDYIKYTKAVRKAGINIKAHFIFGFESDRYSDLIKLWKSCFYLRPDVTAVSLITPLPGSAFYNNMLRENRITNLNWRSYFLGQIVFKHKNMNRYVLSYLYNVVNNVLFLTATRIGNIAALVAIVYISARIFLSLAS
ncbi:MAG: radical SAM protein [Candidatus Zapsychrus exili]|nr:radical SAM protein [Candidatus Zapsychrus exili]